MGKDLHSVSDQRGGDYEVELEYGDGDQVFGISSKAIIAAIKRNILWFVAIIGAALVLGAIVTLLMTPKYVAGARVLIEDEADEIIKGGDLRNEAGSYDVDRFLQTQVELIRSRSIAERIVQGGRLADDPRFYEAMGAPMPQKTDDGLSQPKALDAARLKRSIDLMANSIDVDMPMNTRMILIKVKTNSPGYSAKLANLTAEAFVDNNLDRKFNSSAYARKFLISQLEEARARLEASERDLNQYSRAAGLIRIPGQSQTDGDTAVSVTKDSLVQASADASAASTARVNAEDTWKTIENQPLLSIPQVIGNGTVQNLQQQKAALEARLAEERLTHKDGYPTVRSLQAQVKELDSRINIVGQSIRRSIYLDYEGARAKEASLGERVAVLRGDAMNEQDRSVRYSLLKRVVDTNRASYDALLERYNQINATASSTSNNISLVDRAEVPGFASSPKLFFNMLVAMLLGTVIAGVVVYLRELLDDTIRSPADVEQKLGLPLLGLIPVSDEEIVAGQALENNSGVGEAYHSLVTNLRYATPHGLPRSMIVTSANAGEGKTTTSHAIANDLARLGKRVLLIDADLRRPTLHRLLPVATQPGLTDALIGQSRLTDLIVPSPIENLSYLTALPLPPEPSLLLGGEGMAELVREAEASFDVVVIDCPPLLGLADTVLISALVEGVVFIVNASEYQRGAVKTAIRRLKLVHAKLLGVALTKFDARNADGDNGYYGYSYYSYGSNAKKDD